MPVWNHLEDLTKPAIQSVRECTNIPYRLIVVNNGSTDGTADWLTEQDDIMALTIEANQGFTYAVNRGIEISTAPYIVILCNDVEVDTGWLKLLIEGLESDPKIGAIGPLSTTKGPQWEGNHRGQKGVLIASYQIAFFCTVFRRETIQRVGLLDEQFRTYCSDDDYAMLMWQAGWQQAIHCDVLVKHSAGGTMNPTGRVKELHEQDLRRLWRKWPNGGF